MPELPEVETIARDLRGRLVGERIAGVEVRWPGSIAGLSPDDFALGLLEREVLDVGRRAKFLDLVLTGGHLLVHLRMTGRLQVECDAPRNPAWWRHVHALLRFQSGCALYFHDVRKFGRLYLLTDPTDCLAALGPEPLDEALTPAAFAALLHARRRRLKDLLLDQTFLAGLGNIYADEALWEARLSPWRIAATLSEEEAGRLLEAVRSVLARAIQARGTTLSDYRDARGQPGANQHLLRVYGRAGLPCPRCSTPIARDVVAGRGTHFCPVCQPRPGG